MASKYTSEFSFYNGKRWARGYVEAWVSSETDTTATIYWRILCQQKYAAQYGQEAYGYVDGSQVGYCRGHLESSGDGYYKDVCSKSGYKTVNKSSGSRSVPVTISTRVTPIDGYGSVTTSWHDATCYVSISGITIYEPNAPSDLTNTRESDNKNALKWTAPSTSTTKPVAAILIERQVDGGSWSQIASVSGTATSYNDTTTTADHSYAYRIRAQNSAGYSSYVTSGTTYNTPSSPTGVTASRLAETTVKLEIANAANTATALELQRSTDASAWETVATIEGSPVSETTDEPGGGTFYYRARNTRGELASDWSPVSNAVVTICAPAAPTLVSPASGVVINKSQETLVFEHRHNPIDGSAQTAAQYRFSVDKGATYDYVDVEGSSEVLELENIVEVNSEVTWGVRTKGAHADYGPWSDNRVFFVYQAPSVAFAQPTDGFVVENTPIAIALQYDDPSGSLANATLYILDGSNTVYTRNMGANTEHEIQNTEWIPDNEKTYTLTVAVRSSSSLTAAASREISVDFVLPQAAGVFVENDPETGFVSLVTYVEEDEALEIPASISVWRETKGKRVLLADGLQAGSGIEDRYAPLNADYRYIVTSSANSGAANSQVFGNNIETPYWFCYFDNDIARAAWNPASDIRLSRPAKRRVFYAGRRYPVSYDGHNLSEERRLSADLLTWDEADAFERLMENGGRCVFKANNDGEVFRADVEVSLVRAGGSSNRYGSVDISVTRIDGGDL